MLHESSWARETIGLGSNTDSGSKMRVYCYRDTAILYLAFIIRNLLFYNPKIMKQNLKVEFEFNNINIK